MHTRATIKMTFFPICFCTKKASYLPEVFRGYTCWRSYNSTSLSQATPEVLILLIMIWHQTTPSFFDLSPIIICQTYEQSGFSRWVGRCCKGCREDEGVRSVSAPVECVCSSAGGRCCSSGPLDPEAWPWRWDTGNRESEGSFPFGWPLERSGSDSWWSGSQRKRKRYNRLGTRDFIAIQTPHGNMDCIWTKGRKGEGRGHIHHRKQIYSCLKWSSIILHD